MEPIEACFEGERSALALASENGEAVAGWWRGVSRLNWLSERTRRSCSREDGPDCWRLSCVLKEKGGGVNETLCNFYKMENEPRTI